MSSLQSLAVATLVSLALSTVLSAVIFRPLRALLFKVCSGEEAVQFWARFSLTMLFLSPLILSVVFGLPSSTQPAPATGVLIHQIVSTALLGSFLSMLGMGLWVSALIRRAPLPPIAKPTLSDDAWSARAGR